MVNQEADHKYNLKTFLILVIGFEISILGPTSIFKGTGSQDLFSNIFFLHSFLTGIVKEP